MRPASVFSLVGFLFLWCGVHGALNCRDKASVKQEQIKCFSLRNITLLGQDVQDIQNVLQYNPELVCSIEEEYKRAIVCVFDIAKECLQQFSFRTDILPDVGKVTDGIAFMCQHVSDVSTNCTRDAQERIKQCAMIRTLSQIGLSTDIKDITCGAFQVAYDCSKENLDLCPGRTLEINLELINDYMRPPACSTFDPDNNDYTRSNSGKAITPDDSQLHITMAPMTTAQILTTVTALHDISCHNIASIQAGQRQCFEREGLQVELPQLSGSTSQMKQSILDSILANDHGIENLCNQKQRYQRALACSMDLARQCMPAGYKGFLPSSNSFYEILDDLCNNADEIDFQCATSKNSAMLDCGIELGRQLVGSDLQTIFCRAYSGSVDCAVQVLRTCGCRTTQVFAELNKKLNPSSCSPITTSLPQCQAVSDPDNDLPDIGSCDLSEKLPQCMLRAGVTLPDLSGIGDGLVNPANLDTFLNATNVKAIKLLIDSVCRQKEGYKHAFGCYYEAFKECYRGSDYLNLLLDVSRYYAVIDDVCAYANDINFQCVADKIGVFVACFGRKMDLDDNSGGNVTKMLCKASHYAAECALEDMTRCGCRTTQLLVRTLKNFNSPVCFAIQNPTPQCHPTTGEFVKPGGDGSDAERLRYGLLTLVMLLVTWFGVYVA